MIIYKTIYECNSTVKEILSIRKSKPTLTVYVTNAYSHTIPWNNHYILHHPSKPAYYNGSIDMYYYYGVRTLSKKEFHDPIWRRKIEIKTLL